MNVDVRAAGGKRLGRVEIDPTARPIRVRPELSDRDLFVDWDGAIDDAGHLRRCVVCDHGRLYRSRTLPQVTPFVILLAFAGAILGLLGYADRPVPMMMQELLFMSLDKLEHATVQPSTATRQHGIVCGCIRV